MWGVCVHEGLTHVRQLYSQLLEKILFLIMSVCVKESERARERSEARAIRYLRLGVRGSCELPSVSARNQTLAYIPF